MSDPLFNMAVGQKQWYYFRIGAPPILVYFGGDWDVHWGYDLDFDPWPYVNLGQQGALPLPTFEEKSSALSLRRLLLRRLHLRRSQQRGLRGGCAPPFR